MRGFGNCWKSALKRGIYPDFSAPQLQEGFKLGGKGIKARDWEKKRRFGVGNSPLELPGKAELDLFLFINFVFILMFIYLCVICIFMDKTQGFMEQLLKFIYLISCIFRISGWEKCGKIQAKPQKILQI